jgi:hypothetical protein
MIIHKELADGKWFKLSLIEQLANISCNIDFTVRDPKNKGQLREVLRTREALVDHFMYDNEYQTTDEIWSNYFYQFNYAAALQRGR